MNSKIGKHIHKYKRIILGGRKIAYIDGVRHIVKTAGTEVFKCMVPGCPTYKTRELVIGDYSLCWRCLDKLLMTVETSRLQRPTHSYCRKTREKITDEEVD